VILESENDFHNVCYRAGLQGGRVAVTNGGVSLTPGGPQVVPPRLDSQSHSCTDTAGNGMPGSHPALNGAIDAYDFWFDTYRSSSEVWLCAQFGSYHERLVFTAPSGGLPGVSPQPPSVSQSQDTLATGFSIPTVGGTYSNSSSCQGGTAVRPVDLWARAVSVGADARLRVDLAQSGNKAYVCLATRVNGQAAGGRLTVGGGTAPPLAAIYPVTTDECLVAPFKPVFTNEQAKVQVMRTDYDAATATVSVCAQMAHPTIPNKYLFRQRIDIKTSGGALPTVVFDRD
jgi:hypothetical protein